MNPYLSIVVVARNDNHGENMLYRMQHFVDGVVAQCKRHELAAELIIVEWNPPEDAAPLAQVLHFPENKDYCSVRIIRVPKHIHMQFEQSDKIPLYQMIGKNVGIQRAKGEFILATNIDILFSDSLMLFLKQSLIKGSLYRVDRLDVPAELPQVEPFDVVLGFCSKTFFRINGRCGTTVVKRVKWQKRVMEGLKAIHNVLMNLCSSLARASLASLFLCLGKILHKLVHTSLVSFFLYDIPRLFSSNSPLIKQCRHLGKRVICLLFPQNTLFLHTNACGDFTLLSAEDWKLLKGYPEWPIFSWHLDSVLLHQAKQHNIQQVILSKRQPIYHIEHAKGSGYSAEGARQLFDRLEKNGIRYLSDKELKVLLKQLRRSKEKVTYNNDSWGMSDLQLEEISV